MMERKRQMRLILTTALVLLAGAPAMAQNSAKKDLVVKEYTQKGNGKEKMLDHVTVYDKLGRKSEETEYAVYGQKYRVVYEYEGESKTLKSEVLYNDKNNVVKIRRYEYNANGTKKSQKCYSPDGRLKSTRTYVYETKK